MLCMVYEWVVYLVWSSLEFLLFSSFGNSYLVSWEQRYIGSSLARLRLWNEMLRFRGSARYRALRQSSPPDDQVRFMSVVRVRYLRMQIRGTSRPSGATQLPTWCLVIIPKESDEKKVSRISLIILYVRRTLSSSLCRTAHGKSRIFPSALRTRLSFLLCLFTPFNGK